MRINKDQHEKLVAVFAKSGLDLSAFNEQWTDNDYYISHRIEPSIRFSISNSIQNARIGDVFCEPYTYQDSMYKGCNTFDECLKLARDWSVVSKYKLAKRPYYHKVFISHASLDKDIVDEFVDKVLRLSCGFKTSEIVYTSREDTGVEFGEGIPEFIKDNLHTSSLVLFMISDNYKASEVCLNEMGAAWAMEKKTISIVLPNCGFDRLGWLTSLEKALKMDNGEALDKLYSMLTRTEPNVVDWNHQRESFLKICKTYATTHAKPSGKKDNLATKVDSDSAPQQLRLFDEHFYLRSVTEGEFQYQLDIRLRALENVSVRRIYIKNDNEFVGSASKPLKQMELNSFIPLGVVDIREAGIEEFGTFIKDEYRKHATRVMDYSIKIDEQVSISFVGDIPTIRECDGYVDLPINHWFLCIDYNIDDTVSIPLKSIVINGAEYNYFWHN